MQLQAHLFEVLPGVHVCQLDAGSGGGMEFMRCYGLLASRLSSIMMKRRAFPTALHPAQLMAATPSMDDLARAALDSLPHASSSSSSSSTAAAAEGLGLLGPGPGPVRVLVGWDHTRRAASPSLAQDPAAAGLGSVPEEEAEAAAVVEAAGTAADAAAAVDAAVEAAGSSRRPQRETGS